MNDEDWDKLRGSSLSPIYVILETLKTVLYKKELRVGK